MEERPAFSDKMFAYNSKVPFVKKRNFFLGSIKKEYMFLSGMKKIRKKLLLTRDSYRKIILMWY